MLYLVTMLLVYVVVLITLPYFSRHVYNIKRKKFVYNKLSRKHKYQLYVLYLLNIICVIYILSMLFIIPYFIKEVLY